MTEEQLLQDGYRKYSGEASDVFFDAEKCEHAGNCVRGNGDVFDVNRKPWIIADQASVDEVAAVFETCPSGALQYIRKEGDFWTLQLKKRALSQQKMGKSLAR